MNFFKKRQKRIINNNSHLPQPKIEDYFELTQNRDKLVIKPILNQSRRDKTVLYGGFAINQLLGKQYSRDTYDLDVYSKRPLKHAKQIENSIDHGVNADLAYIEKTSYPSKKGKQTLYRVKLKNDVTEADFNLMPRNICFTRKNGVFYETIDKAEQKYKKMLKQPELGRGFKANIDLGRINTYRLLKKGGKS